MAWWNFLIPSLLSTIWLLRFALVNPIPPIRTELVTKCWTPIEFFTCPVHLQCSWNVKVERITEQIQTTESLDFAGGSGLHCLFLSITMKKLWPRENMYSDAEVNLQMCWWHAFGPELLAKNMHMLWLIR
jgi:hypothetical protein